MSEAPRKRSYKMGHRKGSEGYHQRQGKLSKSRWAWVTVYFGQLVIWGDYRKDEEGNDTDDLLDIKLMQPIPGRSPVTWNLTALTEDELISMKHLIDTAFAWALPIVQQRDKEASDAFENGDDSHSRIYRQVPKLVYRSGPEPQHGEGVQHRSEDAAGDGSVGDDRGAGLRPDGSDVAERDEGDDGSEDDWSEADEPEGVRQVGGLGDGAQ